MKTEYQIKYRKLQDYESGKERYVHEIYGITKDQKVVTKLNFFICTPEIFNIQYVNIKEKQDEIVKSYSEHVESLDNNEFFFNFVNSDYFIVNFDSL